jgi:hypothetical protein
MNNHIQLDALRFASAEEIQALVAAGDVDVLVGNEVKFVLTKAPETRRVPIHQVVQAKPLAAPSRRAMFPVSEHEETTDESAAT